MTSAAVTVAGGGLAGAAVALRLARAGREVTLFERDLAPALRVCGEFLSADAAGEIVALGLDPVALGGVAVTRLRLVAGGREAECALPFPALAIRRTVLDEALIAAAGAAGATVRRGVAVRALDAGPGGIRLRTDDGTMPAGLVLVATGKHDLRGAHRAGTDGEPAPMLGLKLPLSVSQGIAEALAGVVELHLFRGGYAGLVGLGGGVVNLCMAVNAAAYAAAGASIDGFVATLRPAAQRLADRLEGAVPLARRPAAVGRVPYGFRCWRAPVEPEGLWRIGDQAAVTPSFTGDGMAIALASARLAAAMIEAGHPRAAYHRALARTAGRQMRLAGLLDSLVGGGGRRAGLTVRAASLMPGLMAAATAATRLPSRGNDLAGTRPFDRARPAI